MVVVAIVVMAVLVRAIAGTRVGGAPDMSKKVVAPGPPPARFAVFSAVAMVTTDPGTTATSRDKSTEERVDRKDVVELADAVLEEDVADMVRLGPPALAAITGIFAGSGGAVCACCVWRERGGGV